MAALNERLQAYQRGLQELGAAKHTLASAEIRMANVMAFLDFVEETLTDEDIAFIRDNYDTFFYPPKR